MLRKLVLVLLVGCVLQPVIPTIAQTANPPVQSGAPPTLFAVYDSVTDLNLPSSPERAQRSSPRLYPPRASDPAEWASYQVRSGEELRCLASRSGVMWEAVAEANHVLNPTALTAGQAVRLPSQMPSETVIAARRDDTPLLVAMRHNVPLWDVIGRNLTPFYAGESIVLPGEEEPDVCWPYPLTGLELTPQPVVRGRTAVLTMETAEPAACEITYLDRTEPCYTSDDGILYAFIGLSALMEPGEYEMRITLQVDGLETAFIMPLQVEAGRYGYQVINPPSSLNKLMDPEVMEGEIVYLEPWRAIRTPERAWEFPLAFPLPRKVSVSADYGDRRSYGGLVNGYHSGVDYRAWTGLPVLSPADGVVLMTEKLEARGNAILIDHGWGLVTGYWHLSRIDVNIGQHVERGEQIGLVGNTGLSTGSHLHWEMWVNGVSVDGKQWLEPDGIGDVQLPVLERPAKQVPPEHASLQ